MSPILIPHRTGRIVVLADLHCDCYARFGTDPFSAHNLVRDVDWDVDALIIAGDLANGPPDQWRRSLEVLNPVIPVERVYVFPGNHDYYNHVLDGDADLARLTRDAGATFVQKRELRHGTTRIFCCTLWTDFALAGAPAAAMSAAGQIMMDYDRIMKASPGHEGQAADWEAWRPKTSIRPINTLAVHRDHLAWLERHLSAPHFAGPEGRTVVVTHHGPHPATAEEIDVLTAAFHSDLSDLIERFQPDAWFFGHSHRRYEATVGKTLLRNVSIGYPDERAVPGSKRIADVCIWESL